jgi:hypothetical protein
MRRRISNLLVLAALALTLSALSPALARGQQTLKQTLSMSSRIFLGGITLAGDTNSFSGTLQADNPKCVLTVSSNANNISNGVGPNGGILLDGSSKCPGSFELFLSNGAAQFQLPTSGGIGSNTGVYSGTFAIISAADQQTVVWAGTYTQVFNINPTSGGFGCAGLTFCANLGPAFGNETFNGSGLSYLLELDGFTWNAP